MENTIEAKLKDKKEYFKEVYSQVKRGELSSKEGLSRLIDVNPDDIYQDIKSSITRNSYPWADKTGIEHIIFSLYLLGKVSLDLIKPNHLFEIIREDYSLEHGSIINPLAERLLYRIDDKISSRQLLSANIVWDRERRVVAKSMIEAYKYRLEEDLTKEELTRTIRSHMREIGGDRYSRNLELKRETIYRNRYAFWEGMKIYERLEAGQGIGLDRLHKEFKRSVVGRADYMYAIY